MVSLCRMSIGSTRIVIQHDVSDDVMKSYFYDKYLDTGLISIEDVHCLCRVEWSRDR